MKNKTAQDMITYLTSLGFSQGELSRLLETSQPQVMRIGKGQDPNYTLGKKIEKLYKSHVRRNSLRKVQTG